MGSLNNEPLLTNENLRSLNPEHVTPKCEFPKPLDPEDPSLTVPLTGYEVEDASGNASRARSSSRGADGSRSKGSTEDLGLKVC